jgi:hypothetical protein
MTHAIVPAAKTQKPPDYDAFLTAMFLMFARAPRNPKPDLDGSFNLGEIGDTPEKNFERLTPYSLARRVR